ncbi:uncharacterized protein LOC131230525 [Magnolia sinica]|uniref:uncharacterized protein LOC131230525 n=1 Tax=Magnolia sinica TaxID=86752 RepID=UPI00265B65DA|nr:uncharacterized protein LOC131230525 [Magnolia sinica]
MSVTSALTPTDLCHRLERSKQDRTSDVADALQETVAENHNPLEARFKELRKQLKFVSGKKSWKLTMHLFTLKQVNKELLKDYIAHFNEAVLLAEDYDDKMVLSAMFSGLKEGRNSQAAETLLKEKRPRNEEPQSSNKKPDDRAPRDYRQSRRPEDKFHFYTPLNNYTEQIILDIRGQRLLNWPVCMKTDVENRDKRMYCRFHRDHGHNTSDCVDIKDEIVTLIRKGHLHRYTKEERAHKAHSRSSDAEHYVNLAERLKKELRVNPCSLTFTEDNVCEIHHPHDDALVVGMIIANRKVFCILVDIGNSADVIYSEAFERIGIDRSRLRPKKTPLHGFVGDKVFSEGAISLPVIVGEGQHQVTLLVDFLALTINVLDTTEDPPEDLEIVPLEEADRSKTVQHRTSLNFKQRFQMLTFL